MRVAITADLHLRETHPERLESFEILIDQLLSQGIRILIIAGDLFDSADNGRERGYFPLIREDLARFQPARVILGHIHAPSGLDEEVVSPGSPYPINADEYVGGRIQKPSRIPGEGGGSVLRFSFPPSLSGK